MEDFVSFELAKKLKGKGFNEDCYTVYNTATMRIERSLTTWKDYKGVIIAPTIAQVLKWLIKEHDIDIEILTYHTFATARHRAYAARIVTLNIDETLNRIEDPEMHIKWEDAAVWAIEYVIDNMIV